MSYDDLFDSDGFDIQKTEEMEEFKGEQGRIYRAAFIPTRIPVSSLSDAEKKQALEMVNDGGKYLMEEIGGEKYITRPKFARGYNHWDPDISRYVRCNRGYCCKKDPKPAKMRIQTVLLQYTTDRYGSPKKPISYELKIFKTNEKLWKQMFNVNNNYPFVSGDVLLTCVDPTFKEFTIQTANGSLWRKDLDEEEQQKIVDEAARVYNSWSPSIFGITLSEEDYKDELDTAKRTSGNVEAIEVAEDKKISMNDLDDILA